MIAKFKLGKFLTRTLHIDVYANFVRIVLEDETPNCVNHYFEARNFKLTKNYPTIESNIKRGMSYFKANDSIIEDILHLHHQTNKRR